MWSVEYREHACAADGGGKLFRYAQEKKKRESNYPSAATCGVHRRAAHFLRVENRRNHGASSQTSLFTERAKKAQNGWKHGKCPVPYRPRVSKARLFALCICTTVSAEACVLELVLQPRRYCKIRIETRRDDTRVRVLDDAWIPDIPDPRPQSAYCRRRRRSWNVEPFFKRSSGAMRLDGRSRTVPESRAPSRVAPEAVPGC